MPALIRPVPWLRNCLQSGSGQERLPGNCRCARRTDKELGWQAEQGRIVGKVTYREGDGAEMVIRPGPCEITVTNSMSRSRGPTPTPWLDGHAAGRVHALSDERRVELGLTGGRRTGPAVRRRCRPIGPTLRASRRHGDCPKAARWRAPSRIRPHSPVSAHEQRNPRSTLPPASSIFRSPWRQSRSPCRVTEAGCGKPTGPPPSTTAL
jgi:hypothetical protein